MLAAGLLTGMTLGFAGCSSDDAEPLVEPEKTVFYETVPNGSFEDDMKGWSDSCPCR